MEGDPTQGLDVRQNPLLEDTQHAEWDLNKIKKLSTGPTRGERACI